MPKKAHPRWTFRRVVVATALIATTGCSDPVGDAEDRLEIVKNVGSGDDLCAAHRALAAAHLQKKHEFDYRRTQNEADIACQGVELDRQLGIDRRYPNITADNLEMMADNLVAEAER